MNQGQCSSRLNIMVEQLNYGYPDSSHI